VHAAINAITPTASTVVAIPRRRILAPLPFGPYRCIAGSLGLSRTPDGCRRSRPRRDLRPSNRAG
jgi:hypothetical protein